MRDDIINEPDAGDEPVRSTTSRRDFVKRSVVAGGALWAAPSVLSLGPRAFAAGSPGDNGECDTLFKFKYDGSFSCPSGIPTDPNNGGFPGCGPPDGWTDAGVTCVSTTGQIPGGGTITVKTVSIVDGGPTRTGYQFELPAGCQVLKVSAKAGGNNQANQECDETTIVNGQTITVKLPTKDVSYVGMVICCRDIMAP